MSTNELAEKANEEIAKSIGVLPPPPDEIPIADERRPRKRTRKARRLTWKERQYGSGFINGLLCGIGLGIPLAVAIAAFSKWFVDWLAR